MEKISLKTGSGKKGEKGVIISIKSGKRSTASSIKNLHQVKFQVHAEGDSVECSDGTGENCDSNDSENPMKGEKHESINCSDGSAVNCADESVILGMLVMMPADSVLVDNLNAADKKKER